MQWFIANRQMEIVCFPSTDSPESLTIYNDLEERSIETFNGSYSFSVDGTHKDAIYVEAGNYILFRDQFNKTRMYTIITVEDDGEEKSAYCEDIGLDLINESRSDFSASEAKPITYYFDDLLFDTGWKIRVNEVANLSRKLEWQGSNTAYNRILSVLNSFDKSEVEFVIEISGNFIIHQYVDIFKAEHGKGDIKQKFIDTVNLKNLRKTTDIKNIGTCVEAKGGKIEGAENDESVSLVGFEYDDGVYFSPKNDNKVYSRKAKKDWSRYQVFTDPEFNYVNRTETGGHIVVQFSYDTQSQEELFNRSLSKLKEVEQLQVTYEAEVVDMDLKAGDYVQIADHKRNPPIYLEARVLETNISYTDPSKDAAKFGNYQEVISDTSLTWQDAMNQLEENIKNTPVYTWQAYADDKNGSGISLFPEEKKYLGNAVNQKTKEADISDPSVYKWSLIKGSDGKKGDPGTSPIITPNEDGTITIVDDEGTKVTPDLTGPPTGITESATVPDSPYVGMLWKNTGADTGYLSDVTYRWNGSRWDIYTFVAENISASTLSAICANLGTVTAGTINGVNINGSVIKNTFKNWETGIEFGSAGSGLYLGGTTTIQGGRVTIESKLHNKSGVQISPLQKFISMLSEEGIEYGTYDSSGAKTLMQMMAGGLAVSDLTGSTPRSAVLTVDDIIKLKNFNEKTRVIFDAGNYGAMEYPTASNKHALGDTSKIRWIIINWAMYDPSAGTFYGLNQQSVIEYSSTSALGFYDFVLPYSSSDGNAAIEMTIKRIRFPYENNVTYLQGHDMNMGNYSKWWLMRKLIVVEG